MNIETFLTILIIAALAAFISRVIGGWTLAGFLASFLLTCLGAIGGWYAQERLNLPELYAISFPTDGIPVPVVWPGFAALLAGLAASLIWRPVRSQRRSRPRR